MSASFGVMSVSSTKSQQKSSAVENSQQKVKSQGARQPMVKQSKQPTTIQTAYNKTAHVEATSWKASDDKNLKITDKTKTLTRKSRKNV